MSSTFCCKDAALCVAPPECVPANDEYIEKHLDAVSEHVYFGRRRVRPAHRNLHRFQPVVSGEIEQFRIEPEPLDALLFEQNPAALAPEGLESALCVHKRQ